MHSHRSKRKSYLFSASKAKERGKKGKKNLNQEKDEGNKRKYKIHIYIIQYTHHMHTCIQKLRTSCRPNIRQRFLIFSWHAYLFAKLLVCVESKPREMNTQIYIPYISEL